MKLELIRHSLEAKSQGVLDAGEELQTHPFPLFWPFALPLPRKRLPLPAEGLVIEPMVLVRPEREPARSRSFRIEGKVTVLPLPAESFEPTTLLSPLLSPAELLCGVSVCTKVSVKEVEV